MVPKQKKKSLKEWSKTQGDRPFFVNALWGVRQEELCVTSDEASALQYQLSFSTSILACRD